MATTALTTTLERPFIDSAALLAHLDIAVCRWCSDDLEHCHDELVVHGEASPHCLAASCATPPEAHHLRVACAEIGCGCGDNRRVETVADAIEG